MNTIILGAAVVTVALLLLVIAQLEFALWLSRHDVSILRQVPLTAPGQAPNGNGCATLIVVAGLATLGLYIVFKLA